MHGIRHNHKIGYACMAVLSTLGIKWAITIYWVAVLPCYYVKMDNQKIQRTHIRRMVSKRQFWRYTGLLVLYGVPFNFREMVKLFHNIRSLFDPICYRQ